MDICEGEMLRAMKVLASTPSPTLPQRPNHSPIIQITYRSPMPLSRHATERVSASRNYVCLSCQLGALRHRSWSVESFSHPRRKRKYAPGDAKARMLQYRLAPYFSRVVAPKETDDLAVVRWTEQGFVDKRSPFQRNDATLRYLDSTSKRTRSRSRANRRIDSDPAPFMHDEVIQERGSSKPRVAKQVGFFKPVTKTHITTSLWDRQAAERIETAARKRQEGFEGILETHRAFLEGSSLGSTIRESELDNEFEPKQSSVSEDATSSKETLSESMGKRDQLSSMYEPHNSPSISLPEPSLKPRPFSRISRPTLHDHSLHSSILHGPPSSGHQMRLLHISSRHGQQAAAAVDYHGSTPPPPGVDASLKKESAIRTQLREWQRLYGHLENPVDHLEDDMDNDEGDIFNNLTRLPLEESAFRRRDVESDEEEERQALPHFMRSANKDLDGPATDSRFLKPGDLVELEFSASEKESIIAVFARRVGLEAQFFTMHGRWVHFPERYVQYSISDWVAPTLVEPILPYLPDPQAVQDRETLHEQAYMYDLSVPRDVSSPLVTRMVQFHTESQEIYRRNASALDNAHEILSHETDLRYGSLLSAATTLLKLKSSQLPATALFTVRKALTRAGFAFAVDRRSHRLTGYLQIRSREQVSMVNQVREWIRDWQDDLAYCSALQGEQDQQKVRRHRTPETAKYVYNFIEKAKAIIIKSRENRDATPYGNVGTSKIKIPLTPLSDAVRVSVDEQFTEQDARIVRFIEAWACFGMFRGLPRIEALPPLLLHATGLYDDVDARYRTGYVMLQELGVLTPYENRIRFDSHLLLPSSQHSKPLQDLMLQLTQMKTRHDFQDSMQDLRHDWKGTPVYCIDKAGAREIDDGLSVTKAGSDQWWVHIHVANPTAFFDRNHGMAKMARHMGESIYMPERAYMMLPRWTTERHFSLDRDRPCLTFSVRMDSEGRTLERKVRPGFVRNVKRLNPAEVDKAIGAKDEDRSKIVLTVGGEVPPVEEKRGAIQSLSATDVKNLKILQHLAEKRTDVRRRAGCILFDMPLPEVEVWSTWARTGLAWDNPYRKGSRTVEGDPVIRMQTQGLVNWFQPTDDAADVLVREMMLLACETAGSWCSERQIPAIFRGSVRRPDAVDANVFRERILLPAMQESGDGTFPVHIGNQYMKALGGAGLSAHPLRHAILGMDHYGKVTSPLRRYGDMIWHWQIEAALREEARTGRSLVTQDKNVDRSFLPFSRPVLDTIMLGLQPREQMISRAKKYAANFWFFMLLFRAYHYHEAELPFWTAARPTNPDGTVKPRLQLYVHTDVNPNYDEVDGINIDLNVNVCMHRPSKFGFQDAQLGDVWEGEIDYVDVYFRNMFIKPTRLVHREKMGPKEIEDILAQYKTA